MKAPWSSMVLVTLAGFSEIAASQTVTGKIMIDNQEYVTGSSRVIKGNGNKSTDKRTLSSFSRLSVDIAADIEFIGANNYRLEVSGDENIVPLITSKVSNDTLLIKSDQSFSTQKKLHIKIYGSPTLSAVTIDGSSDIKLAGLKGDTLTVKLDGSGSLIAEGSVQSLILDINGSGDANTRKLQADSVSIYVGGAADVVITANKKLNIAIDGAGDVVYYGNPGLINKEIDGAGDISAGD